MGENRGKMLDDISSLQKPGIMCVSLCLESGFGLKITCFEQKVFSMFGSTFSDTIDCNVELSSHTIRILPSTLIKTRNKQRCH